MFAAIQDQQEEIEEAFEDLLIFPNEQALRHCLSLVETYFGHEKDLLIDQEDIKNEEMKKKYSSHVEKQVIILDMMRKELSTKSRQVRGDCCKSNWIQPPKAIDKGVDKNTASRLAAIIMRHFEEFEKLLNS